MKAYKGSRHYGNVRGRIYASAALPPVKNPGTHWTEPGWASVLV
jgi:hypothetical protein